MSAFAPLAARRIWVAWQGEPAVEPGGALRKVPYRARGRGGAASSTEPSGWGSRQEAEARAAVLPKAGGLGGPGIMLTEIDDDYALVGIDLDTCRARADGNIAPWAREVIEHLDCYTEISPSETGFKIFFRMRVDDRDAIQDEIRAMKRDDSHGIKWAKRGGEHPPAIELYLGRRYFTVTERRLDSAPAELRVIGADALRWLIEVAGPAFAGNGTATGGPRPNDRSRSAAAFRKVLALRRRGSTFEETCAALRADPETADWVRDKGESRGGRELNRIQDKVERIVTGTPYQINPGAPLATAKLFRELRYAVDGEPTLHRHRGGFYAWNGAAYPEVEDAEVRAGLYRFLDECVIPVKDKESNWSQVPVNPNTFLVNNVLDALRADALLPAAIEAPAWLEPVSDVDPRETIACTNGLLHLPTLDLLPHTPAFFTHNALDYPFERSAPTPAAWLGFLNQLWGADADSLATLQEVFGYCLGADTSQQKAFLLVGPKRSGKGTIARVLTRLVGAENVVAPTLAGLGTNFGLAPLIGKRVAIVSDARLGGRADQSAIAERLLSITGEDGITIDRKYREGWTGRLLTRFLVLTNELPRFNDASGALASRFIVLVLEESFFGREDPGLTDRLLAELPGILNWAIEGWRRLRERGPRSQPGTSRSRRAVAGVGLATKQSFLLNAL